MHNKINNNEQATGTLHKRGERAGPTDGAEDPRTVHHSAVSVLSFKPRSATVEAIFKGIWANLNADGKYYDRILRVFIVSLTVSQTLQVIEFLIINASYYCVQEVVHGLYKVRTLETFSYVYKGSEKATKSTIQSPNLVREISKKICYLMSDPDTLAQERQEAESMRCMQKDRIYGVSEGTYHQASFISCVDKKPVPTPLRTQPASADMREAEDYMRRRKMRRTTFTYFNV